MLGICRFRKYASLLAVVVVGFDKFFEGADVAVLLQPRLINKSAE